MASKGKVMIFIVVVLSLFSSVCAQDPHSLKDTNNIIKGPKFGNIGSISSNSTKFDDLNSSFLMDYMMNGLSQVSWQKCLGGSSGDHAFSIQQTTDKGYIVTGYADSNDGDVSGNHGGYDFWVVKLDSLGNIQWQKCLGGSDNELSFSIRETADGGYIVAGSTDSNDGDVSGFHGAWDFWVVKLDGLGNIQWQKCLGGSSYERAYSVQQTVDRGYIVAGYTESDDGDVSGLHRLTDFWVVKLDSLGNIQWQKCLGGSIWSYGQSIQQTADRGYIVTGSTKANDGDVSGNHGGYDFWVVKLDDVGNIQWQKCLGGSSDDEANSVHQTADGGYTVAGYTESNDGDVSGNHGAWDFWVVKLDGLGNIQWQKCLGGSDNERAYSVQQTADRGYTVAGYTESNDGDVSGNHGWYDFWVVKLDDVGNIQWQKCLGGTNRDGAESVQQTADGGQIITGYTDSNDGDVSGNHGSRDFWVVKLNAPPNMPTTPSGSRSGHIRRVQTYTTSAKDPDGDRIKYAFDWGDGTTSETGFVDSGKTASASHRWLKPGIYRVSAKATDSKGASSEWSKTLTVTETIGIARVAG